MAVIKIKAYAEITTKYVIELDLCKMRAKSVLKFTEKKSQFW